LDDIFVLTYNKNVIKIGALFHNMEAFNPNDPRKNNAITLYIIKNVQVDAFQLPTMHTHCKMTNESAIRLLIQKKLKLIKAFNMETNRSKREARKKILVAQYFLKTNFADCNIKIINLK
jgi:hypothetical protein